MKKILYIISFFKRPKTLLLFLITFLILYGTLATTLITKKYDLKLGDIPKVDIKAPREIIDQKATEDSKNAVSQKVDKQYSLKIEVQKQSEDTIVSFFNKLNAIKEGPGTEADKLIALKKLNLFQLEENEYKVLIGLSKDQLVDIENIMLDALNAAYETPIEEDKIQDIQKAKTTIDGIISNLENSRNVKEIVKKMCGSLVKPNFFYDKEKTEEMIKEATKAISPIVIKKNQTIVKEGEPVTEQQLEILNELGLLNESRFNLYIYISLAIMVMLVI